MKQIHNVIIAVVILHKTTYGLKTRVMKIYNYITFTYLQHLFHHHKKWSENELGTK